MFRGTQTAEPLGWGALESCVLPAHGAASASATLPPTPSLHAQASPPWGGPDPVLSLMP